MNNTLLQQIRSSIFGTVERIAKEHWVPRNREVFAGVRKPAAWQAGRQAPVCQVPGLFVIGGWEVAEPSRAYGNRLRGAPCPQTGCVAGWTPGARMPSAHAKCPGCLSPAAGRLRNLRDCPQTGWMARRVRKPAAWRIFSATQPVCGHSGRPEIGSMAGCVHKPAPWRRARTTYR